MTLAALIALGAAGCDFWPLERHRRQGRRQARANPRVPAASARRPPRLRRPRPLRFRRRA